MLPNRLRDWLLLRDTERNTLMLSCNDALLLILPERETDALSCKLAERDRLRLLLLDRLFTSDSDFD